jgi:hypothetical protein
MRRFPGLVAKLQQNRERTATLGRCSSAPQPQHGRRAISSFGAGGDSSGNFDTHRNDDHRTTIAAHSA